MLNHHPHNSGRPSVAISITEQAAKFSKAYLGQVSIAPKPRFSEDALQPFEPNGETCTSNKHQRIIGLSP
jgi:hypothetical protein